MQRCEVQHIDYLVHLEPGDGGGRGVLGGHWGDESSEGAGDNHHSLGGGCPCIQVLSPLLKKTVNSPLRQVAEQFDSYAMEIADKRPELLRLINDQVVK